MSNQNIKRTRIDNSLSPSSLFHNNNSKADLSQYVKGSIVRVKVTNFVTYDSCELRPGPHLNVLIGPNGTGKSTIVCAICLGLAGPTKLLGRQKEIGEFVKHGNDSATIEIELYSGDPQKRNTVIRRDITKKGNSTQWHIDGKLTTMTEVQALVESLKIDMNNKCQFLPQDKVVEFAKMSPEELLVATEQAIGSPELYPRHLELNNLYNKEKQLEKEYQTAFSRKERLEKEKTGLERQVHQFEERERHLQQVELLKKKRPWIEYESARLQYIAAKDKKAKAQAEYNKKEAEINPVAQKLKDLETKMKGIDASRKKLLTSQNSAENKSKALTGKIQDLGEAMDRHSSVLQYKKTQLGKNKSQIGVIEQQIIAAKKELENLVDPSGAAAEQINARIEEIARHSKSLMNDIIDIQNQQSVVKDKLNFSQSRIHETSSQLHKLQDVKMIREREMEKVDRETKNAVAWLRNNRQKFQGEVCEPLGLVVQSKSKEFTSVIESAIPKQDMWAIIFERRDDQQRFIDEMRTQNIKVSSICPPADSLQSYVPDIPIEELRVFGFQSYLIDLVDAPTLAKKHLCFKNHFHKIACGGDAVERDIETVTKKSGLREFATHKNKYSLKSSNYGDKAISSRVVAIKPPLILAASVNMEAKLELEKQLMSLKAEEEELKAAREGLSAREAKLREQERALNTERTQFVEKKKRRQMTEANIRAKEMNVASLVEANRKIESEIGEASQQLKRACVERAQFIVELQGIAKSSLSLFEEKIALTLDAAQANMERVVLEEEERQIKEVLKAEEEKLRLVAQETEDCKVKAKTLLDIANTTELNEELKEAFKFLPTTIEDIDRMIHTEQAAADLNSNSDAKVVERYKAITKELESLVVEVQGKEKAKKECTAHVQSIKTLWLDELKGKVSLINTAFGRGFERLRCSGEVSLREDEDYAKYGIEISVKFRQSEGMHRLTAQHQSGGERSVSTVLYMMSLQELTTCPFRVVDEINQGMDPNNERRIFSHITEISSRDKTPQCFYITPKLLPDLEFNEKVNVLCVYNGIWNISHDQWDLDRMIGKLKSKKMAP